MTDETRQAIQDAIQTALQNYYHTHNRLDSPAVAGEDIKFRVVTAAPTDTAEEGTIRILNNAGTITIYVRANKTWKSVALS